MVRKSKLPLDTLFDTTNIEGEENEKVFEITERIEKELSQFPEFIGVFSFGSRIKGYADENIIESKTGMSGSDYDVYVFEDRNLKVKDTAFGVLCEIGREYRKKGIKIQFIFQLLSMENLCSLFAMTDVVDFAYVPLLGFSNLCGFGSGEKIEEWRNKVKEEISKLPKEKQETMFQLFSDCLLTCDKKSLSKIQERIPDFDKEAYLNARRELWTKRVREIYG
jgi:hypothetical protein